MAARMALLLLILPTLVAHSLFIDPPNPSPAPSPLPVDEGVASIITQTIFYEMLPHSITVECDSNNFYTYDAFIAAANSFPEFGTVGDITTRKRELAAFMAQTSYATSGGWPAAPDPYKWGYCHLKSQSQNENCVNTDRWPCPNGQYFYGRGPIMISYNCNYGDAGEALGLGDELYQNPDLVIKNATISFQTAIWFWMTEGQTMPSCHDVMTGGWTPTDEDLNAGRVPGFGATINIIDGKGECGMPEYEPEHERIGYYNAWTEALGVSPGDNVDCVDQQPFPSTSPCRVKFLWSAMK